MDIHVYANFAPHYSDLKRPALRDAFGLELRNNRKSWDVNIPPFRGYDDSDEDDRSPPGQRWRTQQAVLVLDAAIVRPCRWCVVYSLQAKYCVSCTCTTMKHGFIWVVYISKSLTYRIGYMFIGVITNRVTVYPFYLSLRHTVVQYTSIQASLQWQIVSWYLFRVQIFIH